MSADIVNINSKEIKVGDVITIENWLHFYDRSWVGSPMRVISIDKPFYCVEFINGSSLYEKTKVFSTHDVKLKKLSDDFVKAMLGNNHSSEST